jgi:hypothetical protein
MTMRAQLLILIREEYASPEMRDHIRALYRFRARHPADFETAFRDQYRMACSESSREPVEMRQVDEARRAYSHLFVHRIGRLLDTSLIDEAFVQKLAGADELQLLLEVVEPLERALAKAEDREYNPAAFEPFSRILARMKQG